jgi:hypothetical protein
MYREISDLGLFVQTSPSGLGLYKNTSVRYFSVQTSRLVNKKLISAGFQTDFRRL